VSVLRASCDSTEGRKSIRKGAVASLEILLHTIYYPSLHRKIFIRPKQLFIPTTDFAGNTLWSFITPRSFHLRTRWPPLTSLLLLPARFRSVSRSPGNRTRPTTALKSGHLSTKTLHHHGNHLRLHGKGQS